MWLAMAGCTVAPPSPIPTMTAEDLAACQGRPAPRPTPPDFGPDNAYLDRIYEPLRAEIEARAPEFTSIATHPMEHLIVIGARHPTKEMCDDLHNRFGPWIRVEQEEVIDGTAGRVMFGVAD